MYKYKEGLVLFKTLLKFNFLKIQIIDIAIFCFVLTTTSFNISRDLQVVLSITVIRRLLLGFKYTEELNIIFLLSSVQIRVVAFLNFLINNIMYLLFMMIYNFFYVINLDVFFDGVIILNLLSIISYIIRYIINKPIYFGNKMKLNLLFNNLLYYVLFSLVFNFINNNLVTSFSLILFFLILINFISRTFNQYDLSKKYQ